MKGFDKIDKISGNIDVTFSELLERNNEIAN